MLNIFKAIKCEKCIENDECVWCINSKICLEKTTHLSMCDSGIIDNNLNKCPLELKTDENNIIQKILDKTQLK